MKTTLFFASILIASASVAAVPAGNAVTGAKLFLQCRACHTVGPTEASGVGPNLAGVVGATAATRTGYSYSPALMASKTLWTPAQLDVWLAKPSTAIPGNKMAFAGVSNPKFRQDIIAYLVTLKKPAKR